MNRKYFIFLSFIFLLSASCGGVGMGGGGDAIGTDTSNVEDPDHADNDKKMFRWSINLHPEDVHYDIDAAKIAFGKIKELGADMVRFDIPWSDVEPNKDAWDENKWKFYEDFLSTAGSYGLEPIVVLSRMPNWALDLYHDNQVGYWEEWKKYIGEVADRFGKYIYYYQIANESNADNHPIAAEDDWKQFAGIRQVIAASDKDFEIIVNVYANWINWEDALTSWMADAGSDIDIIGIDHYPSTFTASDGKDWYPLDTLISRINNPSDAWYGKKGAILETGYSTWSGINAHGEGDQQNWIDNYAFDAILDKVKANNKDPLNHKIIFANFYELKDLNSGSFFCGDKLWFGCSTDIIGMANDHFGILYQDGTEKPAFNSLKNQIEKFNQSNISTSE